MNVAASLERAAFFFPDRPALSCLKKELTYAELNEKTALLAAALLEMGLRSGERVVLWAANSPEWVIAYFGILKAGGVAVTLSSLLSCDELSLSRQSRGAALRVHGQRRRLQGSWSAPGGDRGTGGRHGHIRAHRSRARTGEERGPPADRHGRDTLHGGDDRHTQGGDADPREYQCLRPECRLHRALH